MYTHTHSHLDYRAVTDLPIKAISPDRPREPQKKSALQQCSSCVIVNVVSVAVFTGWGHSSKPHVFLMIILSALAHETASGTQYLTAHLYVAELVLWGRFR